MIIDAHHHLESAVLAPERIVSLMDEGGVGKAVILASPGEFIPHTPEIQIKIFRALLRHAGGPARRLYEGLVRGGRIKAGRRLYRIRERPDNEEVAALLRSRPERFVALAFLNPAADPRAAAGELVRLVEEEGFRGLKAHAWWHKIDLLEDLLPLAKLCEERGLPLLLHLGGGPRSGDARGLADACPRLKLILAHLAVPYFEKLWPLVKERPNLFVDISGPYVDRASVVRAFRFLGAGKLIFGTDAPYGLMTDGGGYSYERFVGYVRRLPCSEADKERIFWKNFADLL